MGIVPELNNVSYQLRDETADSECCFIAMRENSQWAVAGTVTGLAESVEVTDVLDGEVGEAAFDPVEYYGDSYICGTEIDSDVIDWNTQRLNVDHIVRIDPVETIVTDNNIMIHKSTMGAERAEFGDKFPTLPEMDAAREVAAAVDGLNDSVHSTRQ
jgi:hypothetical protein